MTLAEYDVVIINITWRGALRAGGSPVMKEGKQIFNFPSSMVQCSVLPIACRWP